MIHSDVDYGFGRLDRKTTDTDFSICEHAETPPVKAPSGNSIPKRNVGLGNGLGGQLARNCLVTTGTVLMDQLPLRRPEPKSARGAAPALAIGTAGVGFGLGGCGNVITTGGSDGTTGVSAGKAAVLSGGVAARISARGIGSGGQLNPHDKENATAGSRPSTAQGTFITATPQVSNVISVKPTGSERDAQEDGSEPLGMFMGLLLNDTSATRKDEIATVARHRWRFPLAEDYAAQSKSFYFFVRCLLDMQRNVQMEEEGDALDPKMVRACKSFVSAQCLLGRAGDMYHLLGHFLSNSLVFPEWERFLKVTFEDARATHEGFILPHIDQVWSRFNRFRGVTQDIFDHLDTRFVWHHRLPKVGDLIREHMRRRCFSSEALVRSDVFSQERVPNETVKQIKLEFRL
eukprot:TRINITY_DN35124_c0_g3_i1.p1 TRINITY_DN35124_c0_g3~~TRINITY_DN35124_c0_g3_i1.p1  ORF type:complete len:434 (+),score=56.60 TRINITY_DN35124_c0_g3_i1:95-1303(+)